MKGGGWELRDKFVRLYYSNCKNKQTKAQPIVGLESTGKKHSRPIKPQPSNQQECPVLLLLFAMTTQWLPAIVMNFSGITATQIGRIPPNINLFADDILFLNQTQRIIICSKSQIWLLWTLYWLFMNIPYSRLLHDLTQKWLHSRS